MDKQLDKLQTVIHHKSNPITRNMLDQAMQHKRIQAARASSSKSSPVWCGTIDYRPVGSVSWLATLQKIITSSSLQSGYFGYPKLASMRSAISACDLCFLSEVKLTFDKAKSYLGRIISMCPAWSMSALVQTYSLRSFIVYHFPSRQSTLGYEPTTITQLSLHVTWRLEEVVYF